MDHKLPKNILLIGPGGIGNVFANLIHRCGDNIIGVIASSRASAEAHAWRLGQDMIRPRPFHSLEKALDLVDIDGIIISSPEETHGAYLYPALETGLPLLCEKPLLGYGEDRKYHCNKLLQYTDRPFVFNACNHSLAVNLPNFSLNVTRSSEFFFKFHTNGQHKRYSIIADLMPHCVSFLQKLLGATSEVELETLEVNDSNVVGKFLYGNHCVSFDFSEREAATKCLAFGTRENIYHRIQKGQGASYQVFMQGPLPSINSAPGTECLYEQKDPFLLNYQKFKSYMADTKKLLPDSQCGDLSWAIDNFRICSHLYDQSVGGNL